MYSKVSDIRLIVIFYPHNHDQMKFAFTNTTVWSTQIHFLHLQWNLICILRCHGFLLSIFYKRLGLEVESGIIRPHNLSSDINEALITFLPLDSSECPSFHYICWYIRPLHTSRNEWIIFKYWKKLWSGISYKFSLNFR